MLRHLKQIGDIESIIAFPEKAVGFELLVRLVCHLCALLLLASGLDFTKQRTHDAVAVHDEWRWRQVFKFRDGIMSDEVRAVVTSGKSLLGGEIDIKDTGIVPAFIDVVTEHRHNSGVVYLSFGCTSKDGDNRGEVLLTHRLRMSLVMAQSLRDTLSSLIGDAMKPVDKTQAN